MDLDQIIAFLKDKVELFIGFPEEQLKTLVEGSQVKTFEANEAVVEFGAQGKFLGIILEGTVEACITDDSGFKHKLGMLEQGNIFGEISLLTGDRTMADIIGITPCKVLLIPQNLFSGILITHPPTVKYLSKTLSDRLKSDMHDEDGHNLAAEAFRRSEDPYGFNLETEKPMKILVVNCGSSSLKYNFFDTGNQKNNARGMIEKIGEEGTKHSYRPKTGELVKPMSKGGHREAFEAMVEELTSPETGVIDSLKDVNAIGHRVVHGGNKFNRPVIISDKVIKEIENVAGLAPLHNPVNLIGIREAMALFPDARHVAVFDTAFHQTMPAFAYLYGLPYEYYEQKQIRRYGFHGMSHSYVSLMAAGYLKRRYNELEIITCHLGNGASICAVDHGRSVDTSMGMTPAEGLIMGTRSGNLDPSILIHLMQTEGMDANDLDVLINKKSGLKGLSGVSNDMRAIEKEAQDGNHRALLAFKTFCYQIRKYIGAYVAAMEGLDVLVFTGGIGEGSVGVRSLACQGLGFMGIQIDEKKNLAAQSPMEICDISSKLAPVRTLVIPTNEELMIARETIRALNNQLVTRIIRSQTPAPVPIEVSAHHVHLSQQDVEALFGPGYKLQRDTDLSQPGQYSCKEKVTLMGPKGKVERVRVLGPPRKETQVEIAMTEQFTLGIHPPIRESGDIKDSPGIAITGTSGTISLEKGVICAMRHIHMTPENALNFGLHDKDIVRVRVPGDRELIFGDVLIRVHPSFKLAMHLDTDEANAASLKTGTIGYIDGIQNRN